MNGERENEKKWTTSGMQQIQIIYKIRDFMDEISAF